MNIIDLLNYGQSGGIIFVFSVIGILAFIGLTVWLLIWVVYGLDEAWIKWKDLDSWNAFKSGMRVDKLSEVYEMGEILRELNYLETSADKKAGDILLEIERRISTLEIVTREINEKNSKLNHENKIKAEKLAYCSGIIERLANSSRNMSSSVKAELRQVLATINEAEDA